MLSDWERRELAAEALTEELASHGVEVSKLPPTLLLGLQSYLQYIGGESAGRIQAHAQDAALVVAGAMALTKLCAKEFSIDRLHEIKTVAAAVLPLMRAHELPHVLHLQDDGQGKTAPR